MANDWIVKLEFGTSRSANYQRAVKIAKILPYFSQVDHTITCGVKTIKEFVVYQNKLDELIDLIEKWKTARIFFYGELYNRTVRDLFALKDRVKAEAGKYGCLVNNDFITLEDLPLPIVYYPKYYGAFFAFSKDAGERMVFCECERKAIENYVEIRRRFPPQIPSSDSTEYPLGSDFFPKEVAKYSRNRPIDPVSLFEFLPNICFRCNKKTPRHAYCSPMYGTAFLLAHGWYIQQKYFEFGMHPYRINKVLKECCPSELLLLLHRITQLQKEKTVVSRDRQAELHNEINLCIKEITTFVENAVRKDFGFKRKGESWSGETTLYYIVKGLYPNNKVLRNYRPPWLEGLELDIFIPDLALAFEYQGIQHFKPVEHWGGDVKLKIQQEHDAKKIEICKEQKIKLIHVNYDEELTTEYIKRKIESFNR